MSLRSLCFSAVLLVPLPAQTTAPRHDPQPVYRVNIVERTTPAINYGHLSEPTRIDFAGTALLSDARGTADVEAKRGAVIVRAHFQHVPPPARFGPEYLTYVVWAISPEGRAENLGELVLNGSDKGGLTVSTAMQAFALIVTAEPYFSVSQPSDVVVMENRVRPDTVGKVEQVNATYELLPRKPYTYTLSGVPGYPSGAPVGKPLSQGEYEAVMARYEAQSAIQMAVVAGASQYAADRLAHAQELLASSERLSAKEFSKDVVSTAREATQTAEDARTIAVRRAAEERATQEHAHTQAVMEQSRRDREAADLAAQRAQLAAERAQLESERAALAAARQQAQTMPSPAPAQPAASADRLRVPPPPDDSTVRANRAHLAEDLRGSFETLDTPRGVVVMVPDALLETPAGAERVRMRLASLQSALTAYRGLHFDVDGYTASGESVSLSQALADRVSAMLMAEGVAPSAIQAHGFGAERPLTAGTAPGREQNRRVEIVITGPSIGNTPIWDHSYTITR